MMVRISTLFFLGLLIALDVSLAIEVQGHTSFFEFDKYKLSKAEKIRLYKAIRRFDKASILELKAYTDQVGSIEYNMALSQKRALYVKHFLVRQLGLNPEKLKAIGLGRDESEIANSKKRRVDVFVETSPVEPSPTSVALKKRYAESFDKPRDHVKASEAALQKVEKKRENVLAEKQEPVASSFYDDEKALTKKIERESNRYYIGLGLYQNVLDAEDNIGPGETIHAEWVSKLNLDILGAYQINFRKDFWVGLEGRLHIQDYEIELDTPYVWDEKDPRLYSLALIMDYEKQIWGLGFDVKYGNEPFIFENNNDVTLELSNMLSLKIRRKYKFYESKFYSSRLGLSFERALFGSGFLEPKGELGALAYIDLSKKNWFKKHEVNFRIYYGLKSFINNENDQQEEFAGFQIQYRNKRWL